MSAHGHAHDHEHCAHGSVSDRLGQAEALCVRRGVRLTPQRSDVLGVLLQAGRALGAYDLIELMQGASGKRIAPITVYRALDFLVEHDLVHRIESRNAFLACPGGHGPHPQAVFLICEGCGAVGEATSPALEDSLTGIAQAQGFLPKSRVVELSGQCAACAAKGA